MRILEDDAKSFTGLRCLGCFPRRSREVARSSDCWPGWRRWGSWVRHSRLPWEAGEEHPESEECGYVRERGEYVAFLYTVIFLVLSRVSR